MINNQWSGTNISMRLFLRRNVDGAHPTTPPHSTCIYTMMVMLQINAQDTLSTSHPVFARGWPHHRQTEGRFRHRRLVESQLLRHRSLPSLNMQREYHWFFNHSSSRIYSCKQTFQARWCSVGLLDRSYANRWCKSHLHQTMTNKRRVPDTLKVPIPVSQMLSSQTTNLCVDVYAWHADWINVARQSDVYYVPDGRLSLTKMISPALKLSSEACSAT